MAWGATASRGGGAALAALLSVAPAFAQCPDRSFGEFGRLGYHVREVRLAGPLLRRAALREGLVGATAVKPGAPVTNEAIEAGKQHLRERLRETPSLFESPVVVTTVMPRVDTCDASTKQLDVVYVVYTTKVPLIVSRFAESREPREVDPAARLAMGPTPLRFRLAPSLGYDRSQGVMGGVAISQTMGRIFDRLDADVRLSRSAALIDVAAASSRERSEGWWRALDWRVAYHHADRPTDQATLKERALVAHLTAASRPLGSRGALVRWASLVEAGEQRAALPAGALPDGYVSSAGYGSWKNAVELDVHGRRQALGASYGLQLGMSRGPDAVDYVKHVADVTYEARIAWASAALSHRPLDVSTRWSSGHLGAGDAVPVTERFFGGGAPAAFLPGTTWRLRDGPMMRSFPPQWFNRAAAGGPAIGARGFQSVSVTVTLPIWARPLVPPDVIDNPEVVEKVEAQLNSAQETIDILYRQEDPAHTAFLAHVPTLEARLAAVDARVAAIEAALPAGPRALAATCRRLIDDLRSGLKPPTQGRRPFLVPVLAKPTDEDDPTLPNVNEVCVTQLATQAGDADLTRLGQQLVAEGTAMQAESARIDLRKSHAQATRDMVFPRDVVHSIFHELNLWSVGPALLFDGARLNLGQQPDESATRYALGAGLRLTIASSFHLTAGYSWSPNRASREPRGAGFVTIDVTAPFGR